MVKPLYSDVALLLTAKEDEEFLQFAVYPRKLRYNRLDSVDRYEVDKGKQEYVPLPSRDLHGNFQISCQHSKVVVRAGRPTYAWQVSFRNQDVTLEDAQRMTRVLSNIDKRVTCLRDQVGPPANFAQYVLRVATAMGVTTFYSYRREPNIWHNDHGDWYDMTATQAYEWLVERETAFIDKHTIKPIELTNTEAVESPILERLVSTLDR